MWETRVAKANCSASLVALIRKMVSPPGGEAARTKCRPCGRSREQPGNSRLEMLGNHPLRTFGVAIADRLVDLPMLGQDVI